MESGKDLVNKKDFRPVRNCAGLASRVDFWVGAIFG